MLENLFSSINNVSSISKNPFQFGLSISESLTNQPQETTTETDILSYLNVAFELVAYLLHNYATAVFATALFLNRLIVMSSLKSNFVVVSLPVWSIIVLQITIIALLTFALIQSFYQIKLLGMFTIVDDSIYLSRVFSIFVLSMCVETFYSVTSNKDPLDEYDNSIFEVSLQFYLTSTNYGGNKLSSVVLSDIIVSITSKIWISIVELLNMRKYRLIGSSILSIIQLVYLVYNVTKYGTISIPYFTLFKQLPKLLSLFLIFVVFLDTSFKWCIALLIPSNQTGKSIKSPTQVLKTAMRNMNYSNEQEFLTFVYKLSLAMCDNSDVNIGNKSAIFDSNNLTSFQCNYVVSGYMYEMNSTPEDLRDFGYLGIQKQDFIKATPTLPSIVLRFQIVKNTLRELLIKIGIMNRKGSYRSLKNQISKADGRDNSKDPNRYLTETNYMKFLLRPNGNDGKDHKFLLLPDKDNTRDYMPTSKLRKRDRYEYLEDDNDVNQELMSILVPSEIKFENDNISWYMSMWGILQERIKSQTILTRSQYVSINPQRILNEVILERNISKTTDTSDDKDEFINNFEEELDNICLICKYNKRSVVLWPCRCLVICGDCRISLGHKGFTRCISCKKEVKGFGILHAV